MIEGINICKKFDEQIIFDNFNFRIEDNEFVCFSGRSGKGKTTLLNIIGLIEPITSGKIIFDGKEYLTSRDKLEFYQKKVGFLFQNYALIDDKTVRANLELIHKKNRTEIDILQALDKVGLKSKVDSKVYTLSGGEQQRVALARLFVKKCEFILADEPTGSLDSDNSRMVVNLLNQLNKEGKTIVLVSHDKGIQESAGRIIEI